MRRQRWREGDIVKIGLGSGEFGFARVLEFPLVAMYDLKSSSDTSLDRILSAKVAFKVWVHVSAKRIWPVVGHAPLSSELKERPLFYKVDPISHTLSIYLGDGKEIPATYEETKHLECAAVWDPEHVVDRLVDHFNGRTNKWVEAMRPKPPKAI